MQETNHLKNAHYEAMRSFGLTDDEIEADWEAFVKEYEEYLDLMPPAEDYRPFGSSVQTKPLSAEEADKLKNFEEEFPW